MLRCRVPESALAFSLTLICNPVARAEDLADFAAFQRCFGPDPQITCQVIFDLNTSGEIDLDDYAAFYARFIGQSAPPPGMARISGGKFEMGCHVETGESCLPNELPVHEVYVDSFYINVYEVTNQQYCAYLNSAYAQGLIEVVGGVIYQAGGDKQYADTSSADPDSRIHWDDVTFTIVAGKEEHPMLEVSWYGAAAYANWRSAQHGHMPCYDLESWECDFDVNGFRLPTEAEWEYAARGGNRDPYYAYPWGDNIDGSNANYWDSGDPYETGEFTWTTPAGYYDGDQTPPGVDMANGYGLYDVAGNVWEWCNDPYDSQYYGSSPYDNPRGPASGTLRVKRGGSWSVSEDSLRCAQRKSSPTGNRDNLTGFRLVAGT